MFKKKKITKKKTKSVRPDPISPKSDRIGFVPKKILFRSRLVISSHFTKDILDRTYCWDYKLFIESAWILMS